MNITAQQLGTMIGTEVFYEESLLKIEGVYVNAEGQSKLILGDHVITIEPVDPEDVDFLLKPFSEIKAAHLFELLEIVSPGLKRDIEIDKTSPWHHFLGIRYYFRYRSSKRVRSESLNFKSLTLDQHLYLISKGYDVYDLLKRRNNA